MYTLCIIITLFVYIYTKILYILHIYIYKQSRYTTSNTRGYKGTLCAHTCAHSTGYTRVCVFVCHRD